MIIIGAGMAGLVAGHYFAKQNPVIMEAQDSLPNNHEALLRFRTSKVAQVTGVPFRKVEVRKAVMSQGQFADRPNPYLANKYSRKVTGAVLPRSIWNMEPAERYIAPGDFIAQAANGLRISYCSVMSELIKDKREPVISTIPMPALMKMAGWKDIPDFKWVPIWSINVDIKTPLIDVYQTIHYPDLEVPWYRASLTGNKLTIECLGDVTGAAANIVADICDDFGISPCDYSTPRVKRQEYGKIIATDPEVCQDFIYAMSQEYGIYSLGRFATWRQLLMDDVVDDCAVIEKLIAAEARRNSYHEALSSIK